ncbi:hypothetical protein K431DRAFT_229424 [Polychaeton citri CBS 116435]|uniref:Exoribonuclease phosphorolytic domain-containing protein n=1 Tax=Polychaeton citri CBS 116435 TaxID=1314669 RepID=A0A9P4Q6H2_9PEZI|nr:hypothetical protein K431DRAFT_229424 [Polychaeton citri CBS 116435]
MQADRRRANAPAGGTAPPFFATIPRESLKRPTRTRKPDEHRKIFLRTGVVPSASGSAYYEVPPESDHTSDGLLIPSSSSLKITCTVHGPRPLPRNAQFSPNLLLTTNVKFAPFATRQRRGYVRDASERDLGVHLETALRGVVIADRWPKSACDVVITILEGEEDCFWGSAPQGSDASKGKAGGWGMMGVLAGCITVASAAIVDAGIDCVDLISGGVAAKTTSLGAATDGGALILLDPAPAEHDISAACVVGYLPSRDELTEIWMKGGVGGHSEALIDGAVRSATLASTVLAEAVKEAAQSRLGVSGGDDAANGALKGKDTAMTG